MANDDPQVQSAPFTIIGFLLMFASVFAALHAFYFMAVPDHVLRNYIHYHAIVRPAAAVIHRVAPEEHVVPLKGSLRSDTAKLEIVRGCDGSGMAFLLTAAIVSFPVPWKRRATGLVMGLGLIYLLNQARIIAMYFVAAHRPDWFVLLHSYFVPGLLIVLSSVFFLWWASDSERVAVAIEAVTPTEPGLR